MATVSNCLPLQPREAYLSSCYRLYTSSANSYGLAGPAKASAGNHVVWLRWSGESQNILELDPGSEADVVHPCIDRTSV